MTKKTTTCYKNAYINLIHLKTHPVVNLIVGKCYVILEYLTHGVLSMTTRHRIWNVLFPSLEEQHDRSRSLLCLFFNMVLGLQWSKPDASAPERSAGSAYAL
jgi:hypothetical protein